MGAGDAAEKCYQDVPDGGAGASYHLRGGSVYRGDQEVHSGAYQAYHDLSSEAQQRPPEEPQVAHREGVTHRHDPAHQRRYQHRADDDRRGVHVQTYRRYQRRKAQYPHVRSVNDRVFQHHFVDFLVAHHAVVHVEQVGHELAHSGALFPYLLMYTAVYFVGFFCFFAHYDTFLNKFPTL